MFCSHWCSCSGSVLNVWPFNDGKKYCEIQTAWQNMGEEHINCCTGGNCSHRKMLFITARNSYFDYLSKFCSTFWCVEVGIYSLWTTETSLSEIVQLIKRTNLFICMIDALNLNIKHLNQQEGLFSTWISSINMFGYVIILMEMFLWFASLGSMPAPSIKEAWTEW